MTLIKGNITNGNSDSVELRKRMAEAEKAEKDEEVKTFKETVDSLTDCLEEFTDEFKAYKNVMESYFKQEKLVPEYYDKDQNTKLIGSIDKVFGVLKQFKQKDIDFSPVNGMIAEIKKSNENIYSLLSKFNGNNKSEELYKLITLMVSKQVSFLETNLQQNDYTAHLNKISESISNNKTNYMVDELKVEYKNGYITKVIPIYKEK